MKFNTYLVNEKEYPLHALQKKAKELNEKGLDVINLTIGDPKGNTFEPIKKSILNEIGQLSFSQYPKPFGNEGYLTAVSGWADSYYGVTMDPETEIISCNGSKEAIFMLPILLDWTDKEMFIPSLSYPVYESSAGMLDIPVRYLPLNEETGFLPDLDSISSEIWKKCGVFWLNSPHNPTTAIASHKYLKKLLSLAEKYDFLVCSDECYNDLYYAEKPASCLEFQDSKQWLVFRSLSKRSHMTGFRIGALLSKNKDIISYLKKMRASMGVGTPTFIQNAAIAAWKDDSHTTQNISDYLEKREMIRPVLIEKGFQLFGGDAGFYFWMKHPNHATSESLCEYLLSVGLLVTPGTAFGKDGEGFVRMVYCDTFENMERVKNRLLGLK